MAQVQVYQQWCHYWGWKSISILGLVFGTSTTDSLIWLEFVIRVRSTYTNLQHNTNHLHFGFSVGAASAAHSIVVTLCVQRWCIIFCLVHVLGRMTVWQVSPVLALRAWGRWGCTLPPASEGEPWQTTYIYCHAYVLEDILYFVDNEIELLSSRSGCPLNTKFD